MTTTAPAYLEAALQHYEDDSEFFGNLLDLIPAKYYGRDEEAEQAPWTSKYMRNKKGAAPRQALKEASKKAKRAKFDPSNPRSTTEAMQSANGGAPTMVFSPGRSLAELRARMQAKIEAVRQKRKAKNSADGEKGRAAKKRRKEVAKEKKKSGATRGGALPAGVLQSPAFSKKTEAAPAPTTPSVPQAIDYGVVKFDAATMDLPSKRKPKLQHLLAKAEAKQQRLAELSLEAKAELKQKDAWSAALKRVTGEKVKDDVKLLKRTAKRREAKKRKSQKQWSERKAAEKKALNKKIDKRTANLKNRGKRAPKAGRRRPGFEGATKLKN